MAKAKAANWLTDGATAQPDAAVRAAASEFDMEVVALDVGLHFVEVDGPEADASKVHSFAAG